MSALGKRKRERRVPRAQLQTVQQLEDTPQSDSNDSDSSNDDRDEGNESGEDEQEDVRSIFARHFNTRFEPLAVAANPKPRPSKSKTTMIENMRDESDTTDEEGDSSGTDEEQEDYNSEDEEEEEDEFAGFEDDGVQVIEHSDIRSQQAPARQKREFMSSKPPPSATTTTNSNANSNPKKQSAQDQDEDKQDLKNDLALQRLLSESHLLHNSSNPYSISSEVDPSAAQTKKLKNLRQKQAEIRLHSLGAHSSILRQQSMPASHLQGIRAKAARTEELRRKEAKENGIILERPTKGNSWGSAFDSGKRRKEGTAHKKRDRGLKESVGKFSGGTLKLSARDVADIQGSGRGGGRSRGRGGGRGRGRGRGTRVGKIW